jgi:hypothetical protein
MTNDGRREDERNGVGEENGAEKGEVAFAETPQGDSQERGQKALGQIYFVETEDAQYVKIGFSRRVKMRMSELGTLRPGSFSLRLLGSVPGTIETERWMHQRFAEDRDNGEWFRQSRDLNAFIRLIKLIPATHIKSKKTSRGVRHTRGLQITPELVAEEPESTMADQGVTGYTDTGKDPAAQSLGRKGGKARAANMSREERREQARNAINARWAKAKKRLVKKPKKKG